MATSLQTLIHLLSSTALLLITLASTAQSAGNGTSFAYDFSTQKPTDLTYQGDAHFPADAKLLRLTKTDAYGNPQPLSIGRAVYAKPVTFSEKKKHASFKTTLEFIIKPSHKPLGDGIAFFIAPVSSAVGSAAGNFGVFDSSGKRASVFAVEFDVRPNSYDPVRSPHVGIDIQSRNSSIYVDVGNMIVGKKVTAVINYDAVAKHIIVTGTAGGGSFGVDYDHYDLSSILHPQVEVGISASTGARVAAVHDIFSWSFSSGIV